MILKWRRTVWAIMLIMAASFGMADEESAESVRSEARVIAVVLGEEIRDDAPPEWENYLHHAVWTRLSAKYVRENKLEPTEEEIEEFLEGSRRARQLSRAEDEEMLEGLKTELASDELSDQQRAQKEEFLASLESTAKHEAELEAMLEELTSEEREMQKKSERTMAANFVTDWKINKSLFEKYGGRVVFQQFGMQPYDAYRRFLKDQEKAGAFKIPDDELREEYWSKYPEDPPGPSAFVTDGERAKSEISKRWWVEGVEEKYGRAEDVD